MPSTAWRPAARALAAAFTLAAVVAMCAGCDSPVAQAQPNPAARVSWRTLGTWSGTANGQSESFTVETGALRVTWRTQNPRRPGAGRFSATLHSAISGRPLQTLVDQAGEGGDSAFAEDDPRVSYLVFDAQDIDWTVTLEEALVASPSPPAE